MCSAPGKPGAGFIACREHILGGRHGTGKPASRSCVFHLSSPTPTANPLSLTFPPRTSSSRGTFPPNAVNRRPPGSRDVHFRFRRHAFLPENVSRYLKDPYSHANCPLRLLARTLFRARALSAVRLRDAGLASGMADLRLAPQ